MMNNTKFANLALNLIEDRLKKINLGKVVRESSNGGSVLGDSKRGNVIAVYGSENYNICVSENELGMVTIEAIDEDHSVVYRETYDSFSIDGLVESMGEL